MGQLSCIVFADLRSLGQKLIFYVGFSVEYGKILLGRYCPDHFNNLGNAWYGVQLKVVERELPVLSVVFSTFSEEIFDHFG